MADDRHEHAIDTMARHAIHMYANEYADQDAPDWAQEIQQRIRTIAGDPPVTTTIQAAFAYLVRKEEKSDG